MFYRLKKAFSVALGYDYVEQTGRRRMPPASHKSEDYELTSWQRTVMTSGTRDLARNFPAVRFSVNTHTSAVTDMVPQLRTGDEGLNRDIEALLNWWFQPNNFDVSGRWGFKPFLRLLEEQALLCGDCGILMLGGEYEGKLQAVEGDRIYSDCGGTTADLSRFVHGVETDPSTGAAKNYCICKRECDGLTFERIVPGRFLQLYGYFNRFDSRRGVSPYSSALAPFRDSYEASQFALMKMRLSQILGFTITRQNVQDYVEQDETVQDVAPDGTVRRKPRYKIDLNHGLFVQEMIPGDEIKPVESNQPSTEFQSFWNSMISVALKAVNQPFGFFQPGVSNYAELRVHSLQWLEYIKSRRDVLKQLLNSLISWRLSLFLANGQLRLPARMNVSSLSWEWVSPRLPWLSNYEEVQADVLNLQAGLTSPQRICKQRGEDYAEILAEWAAFNQERESLGIAPFNSAAKIPQIQPTDKPTNEKP